MSWSHDLLSATDQAVFRRLAVFPASFDMDAAEAVTADDDGQWDVVDSLLGLVDRSLVQFDPERGRYRLLETLRQYAADRLADSGETDRIRERHARYFLNLVEVQAEPLLDERYQTAASILALELDNLRSMAMWCIDHAHWADLYSCCERSIIFLTQEAPADAVDWLQQVVDHRSDVDDQTIVDALGMLAWDQHNCLGGLRSLDALLQPKHRDRRRTGPPPFRVGLDGPRCPIPPRRAIRRRARLTGREVWSSPTARGPHSLGPINLAQASNALAGLGQTERAKEAVAEAIRRAEREGHPLAIEAAIIVASANCLFGAEPDFQSSMDVFSGHPDLFHLGSGNDQWLNAFFGWTLLGLGDERAVSRLADALRIADRLNAQHVVELVIRLLAVAFAQAGHGAEALRLLAYADMHLRPYQMAAGGQEWVESRLAQAGITSPSYESTTLKRGEIMSLVTAIERAMTQNSEASNAS